jgi:hypothetical protein
MKIILNTTITPNSITVAFPKAFLKAVFKGSGLTMKQKAGIIMLPLLEGRNSGTIRLERQSKKDAAISQEEANP